MNDELARKFETSRDHLRGVAYRMLGSAAEAEDAVQEAWLKVSRADTSGVDNLGGWLTTVVARVSLDMLRSRKAKREDPVDPTPGAAEHDPRTVARRDTTPETEAALADSVGLALLVVLDALGPAERLAFVLHDLFAMPFEEIAPIVGRTPNAARQLASRARRRVQGAPTVPESELSAHRELIGAFLAALRTHDFDGLVAVLDPELTVQADAAANPAGKPVVVRGATTWAKQAMGYKGGAALTRLALVDGQIGAIYAPGGKLGRVLAFTIAAGRISKIDVIVDPAHLARLEISVLPE